jgi:hypothetical protein
VTAVWRHDRGVRFSADGFRYYATCPPLDVFALPPHVAITIPQDGGFWLIDLRTGVRYRRVTMEDAGLKHVTWNTRGKANGQ